MTTPIDREEVLYQLERLALEAQLTNEHDAEIIKDCMATIVNLVPVLTPPNEPLTLAELREMDGEPVWDEKGKCYLVDTTYQFCSDSDIEIAIVDKRSIKRYPYRRTLYRRPPEGEA